MDKKILGIALIAIIAIVASIVFIGLPVTGKAVQNTANNVKEFNVRAFQFGYEPNTITVNNGDTVRINIDNSDVLHGIRIPDLNVRGNEFVEFVAVKSGTFKWYCTNYCGDGHMAMNGMLVVK